MEVSYHLSQIEKAAAQLLASCPEFRIFLFSGDLGAGKTTLIKKICELLGSNSVVTSPTFALIQEYESSGDPIYHIDVYRVEGTQEAVETGVEELLFGSNYCLVEWPEKIRDLWPDRYAWVSMKITGADTRKLKIELHK